MKNINKKDSQQPVTLSPWYFAKTIGELGYIIALPLVAFLLLGRWIDIQLHSKIVFTLLGMLLALVMSTYIIYKKIINLNK